VRITLRFIFDLYISVAKAAPASVKPFQRQPFATTKSFLAQIDEVLLIDRAARKHLGVVGK
jgi:hypothetical protein